jgi:hypothetical protein
MNRSSLKELEKLSLALKHSEQTLRNLRLVQHLAQRNRGQHLELGAQDLAHRLALLTADIRSLITVVRAQMQGTGRKLW